MPLTAENTIIFLLIFSAEDGSGIKKLQTIQEKFRWYDVEIALPSGEKDAKVYTGELVVAVIDSVVTIQRQKKICKWFHKNKEKYDSVVEQGGTDEYGWMRTKQISSAVY